MTEWLIVDGYNMIGAWEELGSLAGHELAAARDRLTDRLCSHCGYTGEQLVVVFDAHQTRKSETREALFAGKGRHRRQVGEVVYTKKSETADNFIERFVRQHTGEKMTVASSDRLIQVLTFAYAARMSARELEEALKKSAKEMEARTKTHKKKHELEERLSAGAFDALDRWRKHGR